MKSSAFKWIASISLLALSSCGPTAGNSLLTDQKDDPSTHALDKAPKSEELYLKSDGVVVNAGNAGKVDISGSCYTSTYPRHQILLMSGGTYVVDIVDLNPSNPMVDGKFATCKNGRFNFGINMSTLAVGSNQLRLIMQAYDDKNQLVTNDAQGASNITVIRSN